MPETLPPAEADSTPGAFTSGRNPQTAVIRSAVLAAIGRPHNLFRVSVVPLWGDRFRVNVFTGDDPASALIPHSYFLAADARGNVIEATPPITRLY